MDEQMTDVQSRDGSTSVLRFVLSVEDWGTFKGVIPVNVSITTGSGSQRTALVFITLV